MILQRLQKALLWSKGLNFLGLIIYGPAHEILELIAYAQKSPKINAYVGVSSGARYLNLGLSLHLYPYFGYEGSGESAHLCLLCLTM